MLMRKQVLALLREVYPYLAAEYGIRRVGIFGSYAKGIPDEASNVEGVARETSPMPRGRVWTGFGIGRSITTSVSTLTLRGRL